MIVKYLYSGSCVDAGYTGCCVNGNCEGKSGEIPFPCYCDSLCYAFGDCCDDIHLIACPHPNSKYYRLSDKVHFIF